MSDRPAIDYENRNQSRPTRIPKMLLWLIPLSVLLAILFAKAAYTRFYNSEVDHVRAILEACPSVDSVVLNVYDDPPALRVMRATIILKGPTRIIVHLRSPTPSELLSGSHIRIETLNDLGSMSIHVVDIGNQGPFGGTFQITSVDQFLRRYSQLDPAIKALQQGTTTSSPSRRTLQ